MPEENHEPDIRQLFDAYYEKLCLYAKGFVKDSQVAEEIVEELFVYLWLHSSSLKINNSFKAYLFRSTHNNCLKYLRDEKKNNHLSVEGELTNQTSDIRHLRSGDLPISLVISKELEEKSKKIIKDLPEQCRKIYLLSCHENMSYSEIAAKLKISVGTVKTQMFRAFQKLREGLKDFLG